MEQLIINENTVNSDLINYFGQKYPQIIFNKDTIVKPSIASGLIGDIFINDDNAFSKRLFQQFRTKGFFSMLDMVVNTVDSKDKHCLPDDNVNVVLKIFYWISIFILFIRNVYLKIYFFFYPFDKYSDEQLLQQFNSNLDWKSGLIRAFEWHPNSLRCALALSNDLIYVYSADNQRPHTYICCLKHVLQKKVSAIAWHPKRDDILVVACENRILLWTLQSDMKDFKPDICCFKTISTRLSSPIVSIVFDSDGKTLVACSPRNSSIAVIKFDDTLAYTVHRETKLFFSQFTSFLWSPDQTRLLAHTTTNKLCILENKLWSYRCWKSNLDTLCQSSVWSRPTGKILLFVPKNSSKIFSLIFYDKAEAGDVGGGPDNSTLLLDTSEQHFGSDVELGLIINQIIWDKNSTRLVVSFQDKPDTIAIYATKLSPSLEIWPHSTINSGFTLPSHCLLIRFHDHYTDGCLLSVCWSNGSVSHIPLSTKDIISSNHQADESQIRSLTTLCTSFTFREDDSQLSQFHSMDDSSILSPRKSAQTFLKSPNKAVTIFSPRRTGLFSTRAKFD